MLYARKYCALYDESSKFQVGVLPEPGELGRSAKKGYLWEDVEDPSNIEIHHFFH